MLRQVPRVYWYEAILTERFVSSNSVKHMGLVQCESIESQGNVRAAVCLFPKGQKSKGYPVLWTKSIELFQISFHRWQGDGSNNGVNGNKEKW